MWHTYILVSLPRYNEDCLKIRQEKVSHDDTFSDRSPGGLQDHAYQETIKKVAKQQWSRSSGIRSRASCPKKNASRGTQPSTSSNARGCSSGTKQAVHASPSWRSLDSYCTTTPDCQPFFLPTHAFQDYYVTQQRRMTNMFLVEDRKDLATITHIFTKEVYDEIFVPTAL